GAPPLGVIMHQLMRTLLHDLLEREVQVADALFHSPALSDVPNRTDVYGCVIDAQRIRVHFDEKVVRLRSLRPRFLLRNGGWLGVRAPIREERPYVLPDHRNSGVPE